jgi:hypothetical protein
MLPIEARDKVKKLLRRDFIQMTAGAAALAVAGRAARAQAYQAQPSKVTVQFATNRNWTGGKHLFGSDFRSASDGQIAAGSIDVYYKGGTTWDWDRKSLMIYPSSATADSISEFIARSPEKTKLVFLPGFDSNFKDAMISSAQVCSAYEISSIYCFSWPSQGQFGIIPYLTDEQSAYRSGPAIAWALKEIFLRVGSLAAVHRPRPRLRILCHSMGNRALSAALQETTIGARQLLSENYFEHALLMAADEDFDAFSGMEKTQTPSHPCN